MAPTSSLIGDLDAVQIGCRQGPCLEAAATDSIIRASNLATEKRWPEFTRTAEAAGVRSVLSFQLYTHQNAAGALNIMGCAAGAFAVEDEALGAMLATHAAIVLIAHQKTLALQSALAESGHDLIGQAKGVLMAQLHIDAAHAFELMLTRSRKTNTPLHSVATAIIATT